MRTFDSRHVSLGTDALIDGFPNNFHNDTNITSYIYLINSTIHIYIYTRICTYIHIGIYIQLYVNQGHKKFTIYENIGKLTTLCSFFCGL